MDDKNNHNTPKENEWLKNFLKPSGIDFSALFRNDTRTTNNCGQSELEYIRATNELRVSLISDDIAKELHAAIAFGGESVKKTLRVSYADPDQLDFMDELVDVCVAYIGEEVTAILRKHSRIF